MIILIIFISVTLLILFLLIYSCVRISTPYDCAVDNREQEEFIRNYQRKKKELPKEFSAKMRSARTCLPGQLL